MRLSCDRHATVTRHLQRNSLENQIKKARHAESDFFPQFLSKVRKLENCANLFIVNYKCVKFQQNQRQKNSHLHFHFHFHLRFYCEHSRRLSHDIYKGIPFKIIILDATVTRLSRDCHTTFTKEFPWKSNQKSSSRNSSRSSSRIMPD